MAEAVRPEAWRLFVALAVPEDVKGEIEKARAELGRQLPRECVRWTPREQFHLTLKFLGNVGAERVPRLTEALRAACGGFPPLELRAERVGCFPDLRRPRVLWVGVSDQQGQLPPLQEAIEAAVKEYTAEQASERFTGHVTLGRVKEMSRREADILSGLASSLGTRFFGAWTAGEVHLMRSELSPDGARHTVLSALKLAGPR